MAAGREQEAALRQGTDNEGSVYRHIIINSEIKIPL
jgi:hypothetical protein